MKELLHTVPDGTEKTRISLYLKGALGFSGTLVKRVKYGGVSKNGEVVTMRAEVAAGDVIRVVFPEDEPSKIEPKAIPLKIVYEDDSLLVVDKPVGMPVHPSRGNHLVTLAEAVMAYYDGRPFVFRAVGRLDRDTGGLVLIAKDAFAAEKLGAAMKAGKIGKEYSALVSGIPCPAAGVIDAPIARESAEGMKRVVREDGKRAITEYRVLAAEGENAVCRLLLRTGRTHQIRVHMAYIGHPLVGDFLYGERVEGKTYRLFCEKLVFPHPVTEKTVTVERNEVTK